MEPDINIISAHIKLNKYVPYDEYIPKALHKYYTKPIGLYDPLGQNINPLTGKDYTNIYSKEVVSYSDGPLADGNLYKNTYSGMAYNWTNLVVYSKITEIIKSIRENQVTLIKAGTGVGKTVIVPKAALQAFNFQKKVICAIPKRAITKTTAEYSAKCLDVSLGKEVGYQFRGDNVTSEDTKLLFTTTGTIKSIITGNDPYLSEYSAIIVDEAHERSVQIDQLLYFVKQILIKRPDFRLIIMSATIDTTLFKNYFSKFSYADFIYLGKSYPVQIIYEKQVVSDWKTEATKKLFHILDTTTTGDILIFTKSGGEGKQFCDTLKARFNKDNKNKEDITLPYCAVLSGSSSKADTDLAIKEFHYLSINLPGIKHSRKVVAATNVAESSLTIDGLSYVIDCGYALIPAYFPNENASSLLEERISQAAATQRAGRVGRTKPGICYRLYTEKEFQEFKLFPIPDMQKTDLTSDILDMFTLSYIKNLSDVRRLLNELISPPSDDFIEIAFERLYKIAALSGSEITPLGRGIAQFRTIPPEFATCILAGHSYSCKLDIINIMVILEIIEFRMEKLYQKFVPKTSASAQKNNAAEKAELLNKQRKFNHPLGDHFTCLNIYRNLKKYMEAHPTESPREWCKQNGIYANVFISRDTKNWDRVKFMSSTYISLTESIIRPVELKIKYFDEYQKDGGKYSLVELKKQKIEKRNALKADGEEDVIQIGGSGDGDNVVVPLSKKQARVIPSYELNFFPDAVDLGSRDNNILKCLLLGCGFNLAENQQGNIYKTVFPIRPKLGLPDMNSTFNTTKGHSHIIYGQLFMSSKTARYLKFNIVTTVSPIYKKSDAEINENVVINKKLKDQYKELLKNTPKKLLLKKSPLQHHKKSLIRSPARKKSPSQHHKKSPSRSPSRSPFRKKSPIKTLFKLFSKKKSPINVKKGTIKINNK